MKKFLCAVMIFSMVFSSPVAALARSTAERIGENVLSNVISAVIIDAIRDSRRSSGSKSRNTIKSSSRTKEEREEREEQEDLDEAVISLSEAQYQSFWEICLAGSLSEFQKKFENENISPDAVYIQKNETNTVITSLLQLAKTSPNPEIAEFLRAKGARE